MTVLDHEKLFFECLVEQWRAVDQWGSWENKPDDYIINLKYIKTPEEMKEIPLIADIDDRTLMNIRIFIQSIAQAVEKKEGIFTSVVVDINKEGFGRALVLSGNVILLEKVYREAHRFAFPDVEKLLKTGAKMLDTALENLIKLKDCMER